MIPTISPTPAPSNLQAVSATPSARWASKESLPAARKAMGAVEYNNAFYLIGGETAGGVDGSLLRYTPINGEWQSLAAKPVPVSGVQAALLGERIYVPGGHLADGTESTAFDVYDPRQNTWDQLAPLPVAVSGYALAAYEGRLYLFGGKSGDRYLDSVFEYQPDVDRWKIRTPMKTRLAYAGAAVVGNRIFIIGGYDGKQALANTTAYHPARDRNQEDPWEEFTPLPSARYAISVCELSNLVFIAGGIGSDQSPANPPTLQYLPQSDQWSIYESPAQTLGAYGVMLPLEGYLHFLGGASGKQLLAIHHTYQALYFNAIPIIQKDN
jgi:hypothetical protein